MAKKLKPVHPGEILHGGGFAFSGPILDSNVVFSRDRGVVIAPLKHVVGGAQMTQQITHEQASQTCAKSFARPNKH